MRDPRSSRPRGAAAQAGAVVTPLGAQRARAYCGAAHQCEWTLDDGPLPERVEVSVAGCPLPYRLVRDPLTGEPARDLRGAVVFVPARRLPELGTDG